MAQWIQLPDLDVRNIPHRFYVGLSEAPIEHAAEFRVLDDRGTTLLSVIATPTLNDALVWTVFHMRAHRMYANTGIGTAVVKRLVAWLREQGIQQAIVQCTSYVAVRMGVRALGEPVLLSTAGGIPVTARELVSILPAQPDDLPPEPRLDRSDAIFVTWNL